MTDVRTCGELLLGAVEELQHGGDLVPEPGERAAAAAVAVYAVRRCPLVLSNINHGGADREGFPQAA